MAENPMKNAISWLYAENIACISTEIITIFVENDNILSKKLTLKCSMSSRRSSLRLATFLPVKYLMVKTTISKYENLNQ
jgi:hypothetical protein